MRDFDARVEVVVKKFKRLHGDWLQLSARIELQAEDMGILARSMTEDHDA